MGQQPHLTDEEVYKRLKDEWDFETFIDPYRQGGTPTNPVRRTWGTIIDWLINRHKFPEDVVGAGIFLTWMTVKTKGHFKGDGSYGSAGNEFVHAIRAACASIIQQRMSQQIFSGMAGKVEQRIKVAYLKDLWDNMPWWLKLFSKKFWQYRKAKKDQEKQNGKK